ncbi:aldo/keto reductase [Leifsonia poae]|uniref:aldo/keto reductase n=1 Tax=Leifsonia poae TaxID=110933 RepID=UPI001CBBB4BC|nr:aldo/keto reductase [Leifsonia poae]
MFDRLTVRPITIGTSGLGKREGADAALADAIVASPLAQIDTSNAYAGGRSEQLLGGAIARAGGLEPGLSLFTKVDQDPVTGRFDGDRVRRSVDESITRLGVDRFPVLHLHDPYTITVAEAMAPGGAVEALVRLREEGVIDAVGIAAGPRGLVEDYVRTDAFDAVLTHNRYTLVDRTAETVLTLATERGMAVFNAAPFGGGILAGSSHRGATYGYRPASPELLAYIDRLGEVCSHWQVPVPAVALQFSLAEPRIHSTVVGVSTTERLTGLAELAATTVPAGLWDALSGLGTPPASPTD